MIEILSKQDCCGCFACSQICPQCCITMCEDDEGFCYPKINKDVCVNCHLCEKVCPIIRQEKTRNPLRIYAAKNINEEIRMQSSSGGVFTVLAEKIIDEGGIVFGAKFNENWEVVHGYTTTRDGLAAFRGSKYVQSSIGNSFSDAKSFLKQGKKVLFSGTPCQIAGLKSFLRKEYNNLITVDFICHGVPSPKIWRMYLNETVLCQCKKNLQFSNSMSKESIQVQDISFRNKHFGWANFSFSLKFSAFEEREKHILFLEPLYRNAYLKGFIRNLYLRPSCHLCSFRELRSGSDITMGDYWGVQNVFPEFADNKGISLVLINSERVKLDISRLNLLPIPFQNDKLEKIQYALKYNAFRHQNRDLFFQKVADRNVVALIEKESHYFFVREVKELLLRYLRNTALMPLYRRLRYGKKK